ncbi:MAG: hypothetical protein V3V95_08770 [Thermodesulfobacteriota bacterium]
MNKRYFIIIASVLLASCLNIFSPASLDAANSLAAPVPQDRFVITLTSSPKPIDVSTLPRLEAFNVYRLYISTYQKENKTWYRLRLGFFPDNESAVKVSEFIKAIFNDLSISRVSLDERAKSAALEVKWPKLIKKRPKRVRAPASERKAVPAEEVKEGPPSALEVKAKLLMDKAEEAMTAGRHKRAIKLYREVLGLQENKYMKPAQELLGLARERNGEYSKARAEYMAYLILYPKGNETERVRQRLAALETAKARPKKKLRKAKEKKKTTTRVYGSFSQFYNRNNSITELGGSVVERSSLSNDLDLTIRHRTEKFEYSSEIILGYDLDFLNAGDDNKTHLSRAYFDILDRTRQLSVRLGRQSRSTGGVLGRFDGLLFSYQIAGQVKLNLVAGYPVNSTVFEELNSNKYFYGISTDLGTFNEHWDFNLFMIRQEVADIVDRQAVGAEARYFHLNRSLFALVDYDTSYSKLNTLLVSANMKISALTTLNTFLDLRKSPILTTSNALQGQLAGSINNMKQSLSEDEIRALAQDRTAESSSLLVGITRELNKKVQVTGDITVSKITGTPASGGVEATPGTGYEYFLATQLIGSSLIKTGDTAIVGLRYANTGSFDSLTFDLNTRYPVSRKWRINPRVRVIYSWKVNNSENRLRIRPSFSTDYRLKRNLKFEFDGGMEWGYDMVAGQTNEIKNYFLTFGYRKNF